MVVPIIIIWIGFYQIFLIIIPLFANKQKLSHFTVKNHLGYLYHGYSKQFFYWYNL